MNLTNEQKAIIHNAIDAMHDRLLETRVDIKPHEPENLADHDKYTEQVGSLLALDWGPVD